MSIADLPRLKPYSLLHLVGYGLLFLTLLDVISLFIPPQFTNSAWELQTAGLLVERVPVPLLGLLFVFLGDREGRPGWERALLPWLARAALGVGLLYLCLTPLILSAAWRLNSQNRVQLSQTQEQLAQVQQMQERLNSANDTAVQRIISQLQAQGRLPNGGSPSDVKNQLQAQVNQARQTLETGLKAAQTEQTNLWKNAIKWLLGAIVAAVLFLNLGRKGARMGSGPPPASPSPL